MGDVGAESSWRKGRIVHDDGIMRRLARLDAPGVLNRLGKVFYDPLNMLGGNIRLVKFGVNCYQDKVVRRLLPVDQPVSRTLPFLNITVPGSGLKKGIARTFYLISQ